VIDLIRRRMLEPQSGTAWMQFTLDFQPLPAILFETQWGRDAEPAAGDARALDTTSYGHNVEFGWLLLLACDLLGIPRNEVGDTVLPLFEHCLRYGIDWEIGGVFVDGAMQGPPVDRQKQFWQQAEVLVGMLDALLLTKETKYWDAFKNVHAFVFEHFVVDEVGEWYERLDRDGTPIDDALGHSWKISYHTVRSMIQTVARLDHLLSHEALRSGSGTKP
jgi:mannobiose 2-epimerase